MSFTGLRSARLVHSAGHEGRIRFPASFSCKRPPALLGWRPLPLITTAFSSVVAFPRNHSDPRCCFYKDSCEYIRPSCIIQDSLPTSNSLIWITLVSLVLLHSSHLAVSADLFPVSTETERSVLTVKLLSWQGKRERGLMPINSGMGRYNVLYSYDVIG